MNFNLYVFGLNKAEYSQYPNDYTSALLSPLCSEVETSKGWIIRDHDLVHYVYVEKLNDACVLGVCLIFNRAYAERVGELFSFLRNIVETTLLDQGRFITRNDNGDIEFVSPTLSGDTKSYEYIKNFVNSRLDSFDISSIPTTYNGLHRSYELSGDATNSTVLDLQKEYNHIVIDFKQGIAENRTQKVIMSLQSAIADKSKQVEEQRQEISRLVKIKKQYRIVIILAIVVIACAVGLLSLNHNLNDTQEQLESTRQELNVANELKIALYKEIEDNHREIEIRNRQISELETEVDTLTDRAERTVAKLNGIISKIPIVVTGTSCSLENKWLDVRYYAPRAAELYFTLKVYKRGSDNTYKTYSFYRDVEEGEHTFTYYFSGYYDSSKWYKFEVWSGGRKLYTSEH